MAILKKENILYERDAEGKFIPQKVKLVEPIEGQEDTEIIMVPMKRGELKTMFKDFDGKETTKDQDAEMIEKYCIEPKITKEDFDALKPSETNAIVLTILHYSGLKSKKQLTKQLEETENEFLKK